MRTIVLLGGLALVGAGLYLIYGGARLMDANLSTGTFSWRCWEAIFWLKHPPQLEHGLADNGRAWLGLVGGALLGLLGWRVLRTVGRLDD